MDENEVQARNEGEASVTPEERVETFASDVASKAQQVASGEMTPEEFVEGCMAQLEEVKGAMNDTLGGLGKEADEGLALPEEEEA